MFYKSKKLRSAVFVSLILIGNICLADINTHDNSESLESQLVISNTVQGYEWAQNRLRSLERSR